MITSGCCGSPLMTMMLSDSGIVYDSISHCFYCNPRNPVSSVPLKVISLFTGCGGLDIGLERAGFDVAACVEIDKDCWNTIEINRQWPIFKEYDGDITKVSTDELLAFSGLEIGEAALVVGGAPCQPFSNMGKKEGINNQQEGTLFQHFVRIVKETQPVGFIFENVSGFLHKKHGEIIEYMKTEFSRLGYSSTVALLNAADYGVPQTRRRVFIMGRRDGLEVGLPLPKFSEHPKQTERHFEQARIDLPWEIKKWVTVRDAFDSIPIEALDRPDCLGLKHSDEMKARMDHISGKMNFKQLPDHLKPNCWKTGKHQGADTFGRLQWDRPSVTIRTCAYNPSKGRYIHPVENRGLNTLEMASLQSFPLEWRFLGSLISVGRQIGNAVPPLLAKEIGNAMRDQLIDIMD